MRYEHEKRKIKDIIINRLWFTVIKLGTLILSFLGRFEVIAICFILVFIVTGSFKVYELIYWTIMNFIIEIMLRLLNKPIGETLMVGKKTHTVLMKFIDLKPLKSKEKRNYNDIFIEDFKQVVEYAKAKGWKDINTVTHELFILGIVRELVKKEDRKKIIEDIHNLSCALEYETKYGLLKMTKSKYKVNIEKACQHNIFTNKIGVNDTVKKEQFYKLNLLIS